MKKLLFSLACDLTSVGQCVKKLPSYNPRFIRRYTHYSFRCNKFSEPNNTVDLINSSKFTSQSPKALLEESATFVDTKIETPDDIWSTSPYPKGSNWKQSQAKYSFRPNIDPNETSVILFPGQGAQFVGMVKTLINYPNVKDMYQVASEILNYDLLELCSKGPKNKLDQTEFCQVAMLVTSLAAVEKLKVENPGAVESCVAAAGFSIGELAALTFAGAFIFEDAVKLAQVRGKAMQLASELTPSGMMTVFFSPGARIDFACHVARKWCMRKGLASVDCRISNYLFPQCKVIAGNEEALDFIDENAKDFKIHKIKRLPVSGAFHTDLMQPAIEPFKEALRKVEIDNPLIAVHSNVDGKAYKSAWHVRRTLLKQVCAPVRWEQTLHILYERNTGTNFPKTYECGPGTSLKTILKMVNNKAYLECSSVLK